MRLGIRREVRFLHFTIEKIMTTPISAALTAPELKKAKVKDPQSGKEHEFNIKALTYRVHGRAIAPAASNFPPPHWAAR